jgi:hypothetical protein
MILTMAGSAISLRRKSNAADRGMAVKPYGFEFAFRRLPTKMATLTG